MAETRNRLDDGAPHGNTSLLPIVAVALALVIAGATTSAAGSPCGTYVRTLASPTAGLAPFRPFGVAVDRQGRIYATDVANARIVKFDRDGTVDPSWGAQGSIDARFHESNGIAIDRRGNVYATDVIVVFSDRLLGGRVLRFDRTGAFVGEWGYVTQEPWRFSYPNGVAVDDRGRIYVTDLYAARVEKFRNDGTFIAMWGDVEGSRAELRSPTGVAIARGGRMYVTDLGHTRVVEYSTRGRFVRAWSPSDVDGSIFTSPSGIAVDRRHHVYVTDRAAHRVAKYDRKGRLLTAWGNPGSADGDLLGPAGIAVDRDGNVFVADVDNGQIVQFACR